MAMSLRHAQASTIFYFLLAFTMRSINLFFFLEFCGNRRLVGNLGIKYFIQEISCVQSKSVASKAQVVLGRRILARSLFFLFQFPCPRPANADLPPSLPPPAKLPSRQEERLTSHATKNRDSPREHSIACAPPPTSPPASEATRREQMPRLV